MKRKYVNQMNIRTDDELEKIINVAHLEYCQKNNAIIAKSEFLREVIESALIKK